MASGNAGQVAVIGRGRRKNDQKLRPIIHGWSLSRFHYLIRLLPAKAVRGQDNFQIITVRIEMNLEDSPIEKTRIFVNFLYNLLKPRHFSTMYFQGPATTF